MVTHNQPLASAELSKTCLNNLEAKQQTLQTMSDEEIMGLIANQQDRAAFDELHRRYIRILYSAIQTLIYDHEDIEDVLQEVFTSIWKKASYFKQQRGKVSTWLTRVAKNRAIDRIRAKGRRERLRQSYEDECQTSMRRTLSEPISEVSSNENQAILKRAVLKLTPEQQVAIEMAYFQEMSQTDVARKLGQPLGTIKARIRRGINRLHHLVKNEMK